MRHSARHWYCRKSYSTTGFISSSVEYRSYSFLIGPSRTLTRWLRNGSTLLLFNLNCFLESEQKNTFVMSNLYRQCPKCGGEIDPLRQICPHCRYDLINGKMPGENGYNGNWNGDAPAYFGGGNFSWRGLLACIIVFGGCGIWIWLMNIDSVFDWVTDLPDFFSYLIMFGPLALFIFLGLKIGLKK